MNKLLTLRLGGLAIANRKPVSKVPLIYLVSLVFQLWMDLKIHFWEDLWGGDQPLYLTPSVSLVSKTKHSPISMSIY